MTKGKYTKGFTLVELLVVIAIIAILAGAMFLVLNPANLMMKARDSKRMSEVSELSKAIAMSIADSKITVITAVASARGAAGATNTSCAGARTILGVGWVKFTGTLATYYPNILPADPTNVTPYCYLFGGDVADNTWEISVPLESLDNTVREGNDGGNNATEYEVGTKLTIV